MYKKVEINCGKVLLDGEVIGVEKDNYHGTMIVETESGTTMFAEYGTSVDGEFYPFCRSTSKCLGCNRHDSPNCRYNRTTNKNPGYYLEVPNAQ